MLCAVVFPFYRDNSTSQNDPSAFSALFFVSLLVPLGLCKLTRLLWPFGVVKLPSPWSTSLGRLLTKLPQQPPGLGSSLAFVYLLRVGACLGTSFPSSLCLAWRFDGPSDASCGCMDWHTQLGRYLVSGHRFLCWCAHELGWVCWGYFCASISSS